MSKRELVEVKLELDLDDTLCRTCLSTGASEPLFGSRLAVALQALCGVRAAPGDGLPVALCTRCTRGLRAAAALRERALQADRLLRDARQRLLKQEWQSPGADDQWLVVVEEAKDKPPTPRKRSPNKKPATRNRKATDRLQCTLCGYQASKPSALARHSQGHTGERPFACGHCSRTFTAAGNLRRHAAVHAAGPAFTCDACGRCFRRRDDIIVHLRTHSGARPYACEQCAARFAQAGALLRHKRSHSGVRAYVCPHSGCGKAFTNGGLLHKHALVHSTRRDFVCDACSRAYKSKSALNLHAALWHAAGSCACAHCPAAFSTPHGLQLHTARKHHPPPTTPAAPTSSHCNTDKSLHLSNSH